MVLRPVLFTDESRYYLDSADRGARVWQRHGARIHAPNIAKHDKYGAAQSLNGCNELVVLENSTLSAKRNGDEI